MSHHSALTSEEWRMRGFSTSTMGSRIIEYPDEPWTGRPGPSLFVTVDGQLGTPDAELYHGGWAIDARKTMALANLSLTLQGLPGSIAMPDVAVCQSAAWYFRKLARELIAAAKLRMDPDERQSFLDHARSLTDGNEALFRLSETLKALVPPE
jgi:hypothetical protein